MLGSLLLSVAFLFLFERRLRTTVSTMQASWRLIRGSLQASWVWWARRRGFRLRVLVRRYVWVFLYQVLLTLPSYLLSLCFLRLYLSSAFLFSFCVLRVSALRSYFCLNLLDLSSQCNTRRWNTGRRFTERVEIRG